MIELLKGKKTYLVGLLVGVITALHAIGKIDAQTYQTIAGFLGGLGFWTLRAGIEKNK